MADRFDFQRVPFARGNLHFGILKFFGTFTAHDFVDAEVVFERVVAGDVIVAFVLRPPDQAAPLVELARDRVEFDTVRKRSNQKFEGRDSPAASVHGWSARRQPVWD